MAIDIGLWFGMCLSGVKGWGGYKRSMTWFIKNGDRASGGC